MELYDKGLGWRSGFTGPAKYRRPGHRQVARLNAALRKLTQQPGTIPAAKLSKKIADLNAIIAKLDDGKQVFFKDIVKEFLDQNGGLSGEIMPDYLHLSGK